MQQKRVTNFKCHENRKTCKFKCFKLIGNKTKKKTKTKLETLGQTK